MKGANEHAYYTIYFARARMTSDSDSQARAKSMSWRSTKTLPQRHLLSKRSASAEPKIYLHLRFQRNRIYYVC